MLQILDCDSRDSSDQKNFFHTKKLLLKIFFYNFFTKRNHKNINSNCDKTLKSQIVIKLKNLNCDETQKLKL